MATSSAKENILKKIRQALSNPVPLPFPNSEGNQPVFHVEEEDLAVVFADEFSKLQGKFAYCTNEQDMAGQVYALLHQKGWTKVYIREEDLAAALPQVTRYPDLPGCDVSITGCESLVARTGTIVMSSAQASGRTTSVYAPVHICIARSTQLVPDIRDALLLIREKYANRIPSLVTFASGPSRTADIEKTLVTGVHGPKEVYCFLLES
ncbi:MAG: lactate utilization protein [Ferruginibacter sp.]